MLEQLQKLAKSGRIDEALNLANQACNTNPGQPELWVLRASLQAQKQDINGVVDSCKRALSLQPTHPAARYNLAVALQHLKRHTEAIEQYQELLKFYPQNATYLNNLGSLLIEESQAQRACELLESAIAIQPDFPLAHNNLGLAYDKLCRHTDAQKHYQTALQYNPQLLAAHNNLIRSQHLEGYSQQALDKLETLISQQPNNIDAHLLKAHILTEIGQTKNATLYLESLSREYPGNIDILFELAGHYSKTGHLDEAIKNYEAITTTDPEHIRALNNLGSLHQSAGNSQKALDLFMCAAKLAPQAPEIQINLASLYWSTGEEQAAFRHCLSALAIKPKERSFQQYFVEIFSGCSKFPLSQLLIETIKNCLLNPGVDQQPIMPPTLTLILTDKRIQALFQNCSRGDIPAWHNFLVLQNSTYTELFNLLMMNTVMADPAAEAALRAARRSALFHFLNPDGSITHTPRDDELSLLAALAHQCLNNEYVYTVSDDEKSRFKTLTSCDRPDDKSSLTSALLIALYQPLPTGPRHIHLSAALKSANSNGITELAVRHFNNPALERALRNDIPFITDITDNTSSAVREQYEESPYPRWLSINLQKPRPLARVLQESLPQFTPPDFGANTLQTLIAGCGTGKHAILAATRFTNNHITAVDLSLSSLAYGLRKSRELGIKNIEFHCGDILNLHQLKKRFHIIESVGVLHHLHDPAAGLQRLRSLLVPRGLMNLGLYSKLARRSVYAAREQFYTKSSPPDLDEIRRVRTEITAMRTDPVLHSVTNFRDFYSLSECRDLLFHTQEHSYKLDDIKELLEQNKLDFLGFEFPNTRPKLLYKHEHPGEGSCSDLTSWDAHEQKYPDTFSGMYVFWCQARD